MKLIIVSGLAGSGKTGALHMLEDLGYYCIDNIPLALLRNFSPQDLHGPDLDFEQLAVAIDSRARPGDIKLFPERIAALKETGLDIEVLFFHADNDVILRRYSETRRKHPLTDENTPLLEAIEKDRELLKPIAEHADMVIDTSNKNIHQLREMVQHRIQGEGPERLSVLFQSFGFKYGVPKSVDFVFDVRCLPNPHWVDSLRDQDGRDAEVADFIESSPEAKELVKDIGDFLERWLPEFQEQDRTYVTIAVGCTGGRHRSVYLVEKLAKRFKSQFPLTLVRHTELP